MILIKTKIKIKQQLQNNIFYNIFYNNGNSGNLLHQISTACS
jgi:hypothetical protein